MKAVKDTKSSKEFYAIISLLFLTFVIFAMLLFNIEKHTVIELNSANIQAIDDRAVRGSSVAQVINTNEGIEFSCQMTKSYLDQAYCKLVIDIQDLSKESPFTGLDLSSYEQIGLWIQHNHSTQPGTRIELHNFNPQYSDKEDENSLKHNTFEYLEAYVTNPVWLKLNDFSIPQWWNNKHNLSLKYGGTDFSNTYTIAIGPGTKSQEGSYKLTIERIELKGKYIPTSTLISLLVMLWSIALGYMIRRMGSKQKISIEAVEQAPQNIEFGTMIDPLTGALNRIGLRKFFDQLTPTDLHQLSVIFINIDYFEDIYSNYGRKVADEVLQNFVNIINDTCRSSDTVVRWSTEEFLLVCPETALAQAVDVAEKIRVTIQDTTWPKEIKMSCSSGVAQMFDEELNDLITRANKALHKVKNTGTNKTAAA
jgi:diguanylate cyclase (GGDEF)-like protein